MKQAEQMRDAVLSEHTRLKQAEMEAEKWAGQFRQAQAQLREQAQAVLQLKQDKQMSLENANRYGCCLYTARPPCSNQTWRRWHLIGCVLVCSGSSMKLLFSSSSWARADDSCIRFSVNYRYTRGCMAPAWMTAKVNHTNPLCPLRTVWILIVLWRFLTFFTTSEPEAPKLPSHLRMLDPEVLRFSARKRLFHGENYDHIWLWKQAVKFTQ